MSTEFLMNLTEPSPNRKLHPPGWLLVAFEYMPHANPPPAWSSRQPPQGYCCELGGTTVLNEVSPAPPIAQRRPLSFEPTGNCFVWKYWVHNARSDMTCVILVRMSNSPPPLWG